MPMMNTQYLVMRLVAAYLAVIRASRNGLQFQGGSVAIFEMDFCQELCPRHTGGNVRSRMHSRALRRLQETLNDPFEHDGDQIDQ